MARGLGEGPWPGALGKGLGQGPRRALARGLGGGPRPVALGGGLGQGALARGLGRGPWPRALGEGLARGLGFGQRAWGGGPWPGVWGGGRWRGPWGFLAEKRQTIPKRNAMTTLGSRPGLWSQSVSGFSGRTGPKKPETDWDDNPGKPRLVIPIRFEWTVGGP